MRLVILAQVLSFAVACHAQEFYLVDDHGKTNGPFSLKQDAQISIGATKGKIVKVAVKEQQVLNDLNDIIIPEIELRQSSIQDALAFLQKAAADDPKKRGIHICTGTTQISVADGARVLLGGGIPSRDGKRMVYMFVSARKVGIHGQDMSAELKEACDRDGVAPP